MTHVKEATQALRKLRFRHAADLAFRRDLLREAALYLQSGAGARHGDGWMYAKVFGLALTMAAAYAAALHASTPGGFALAYIGAVCLAMALGMNALHDAAHGALFKSARANAVVRRLVALPVGIDAGYWTARHVHVHHTYANIDGYDLDTEPNPFLRQTPFQPWSPQYRWQHRYWPVVAALSLPYLCWYSDWADRLQATKLHQLNGPVHPTGWGLFLLGKATHAALLLGLPMWALAGTPIGWGTVLGCYVVGQMLASSFLVALILGTHWAEVEFFQPPASGTLPHTWYEHSFHTACDWMPRPAWAAYWLGGLNAHLTHHLFPTYSHRHYPALARIVCRVAGQHRLPYRQLNYAQLWASQQQFLKTMGQRPAPVIATK